MVDVSSGESGSVEEAAGRLVGSAPSIVCRVCGGPFLRWPTPVYMSIVCVHDVLGSVAVVFICIKCAARSALRQPPPYSLLPRLPLSYISQFRTSSSPRYTRYRMLLSPFSERPVEAVGMMAAGVVVTSSRSDANAWMTLNSWRQRRGID